MKSLLRLPVILSLITSVQLRADTIAEIWPLRLTLPIGYRHERGQGMDSRVGFIHVIDPKLEVLYDVGPMAGSPKGLVGVEKSGLAAVVYYEEVDLDGVPAYFLGVRNGGSERRLFLNFPGANAFFVVNVATPKAMIEAKAAFLRIKFSRLPRK